MSEIPERKIKKIDFLKSVGSNPDRRIDKIGAELGLGRTGCYKYMNEFVENAVLTDSDADFPRKLLLFYNKDIPETEERLTETDVQQLQPYIDQYYQKHMPGHVETPDESINIQEDSNRTMSSSFDPSAFQRKDMSSEEGLLRGLLENAKFVHPSVIDRFMKIYDINKENWNKNPLGMLEYMKHVFTNQQGEEIFKIFQQSRGKFVFGADKPQQQGMDPMMLMMMMSGGNMNPAMIPMMMNGQGGDQSAMMNAMMMSQMSAKSAKDQQKQEQNEMFEKLVNTMMLKMVGGSLDDKKPMYDMMGMGGMMGPPTMREVLDEGGRVKARDYIPNFGGQHPQGGDPLSVMMIGKLMDQNTAMMQKTASTGETPMNLLLGLIPHFKDQGNSANQLSSMLQTMNQIAPGFFERRNEPQGGLEVYKLKFDTELAMQAQKIELAKMEHTWEIDKLDRTASNDNAKNWMQMIGNFGEKIVTTVGPAVMEGFGKGMLGKGGAQAQQQQYTPEQMQAIMRARQMQAAQQQQAQQSQAQTSQQAQAPAAPQPQADMSTIYLITNLQNALNQSEKDKQMMMQQIQELQSQPTQHQQSSYNIDERRLAAMPSGQLREILQELNMQNQGQDQLKSRIEAVIANRILMDQQPQQQQEEPRDDTTPDERAFNSGNAEPEQASSEQTHGEEENAA